MEAKDLLKEENKHLLEAAISHDINTRFQSVILGYVKYLQKSIEEAQKGESVDMGVVSALGDSIRLLLIMQKKFSEMPDQGQHKKTTITEPLKERAIIGNELIKAFYIGEKLIETIKIIDESEKIIEFIKNKKNCDIEEIIDILEYAKSYAANIKKW